jgi:hypothetical protein
LLNSQLGYGLALAFASPAAVIIYISGNMKSK